MKLGSSFPVPAAPDKVLALFLDPTTMHLCIPGCEDLEQVDDTHYRGSLVNEIAHVRFKAGFGVEITSTTTPADTSEPAVVTAILKGEDRRLGSTIRIDATLRVAPVEGGSEQSEVSYELELAMWGKLGRLGEAVIRRRTAEVEKQFAEALTAVCSGQPVPSSSRPAHRQRTGGVTASAGRDQDDSTSRPAGIPAVGAPQTSDHAGEGRPTEDLVILALAVASAFAYGILWGGRRSGRR